MVERHNGKVALIIAATGQDGGHLAEFLLERAYTVHGLKRRSSSFNIGRCLVQVGPRYFRPTEVDVLIGDPTKAHTKLGWKQQTSARALCAEMVREDLKVVAKEKRRNAD